MFPFGGGPNVRVGRSRVRVDQMDCADIMLKAVERKRSRSIARRESFSGTEDDLKKFRDAVESNEKDSNLQKELDEYAIKVREIRGTKDPSESLTNNPKDDNGKKSNKLDEKPFTTNANNDKHENIVDKKHDDGQTNKPKDHSEKTTYKNEEKSDNMKLEPNTNSNNSHDCVEIDKVQYQNDDKDNKHEQKQVETNTVKCAWENDYQDEYEINKQKDKNDQTNENLEETPSKPEPNAMNLQHVTEMDDIKTACLSSEILNLSEGDTKESKSNETKNDNDRNPGNDEKNDIVLKGSEICEKNSNNPNDSSSSIKDDKEVTNCSEVLDNVEQSEENDQALVSAEPNNEEYSDEVVEDLSYPEEKAEILETIEGEIPKVSIDENSFEGPSEEIGLNDDITEEPATLEKTMDELEKVREVPSQTSADEEKQGLIEDPSQESSINDKCINDPHNVEHKVELSDAAPLKNDFDEEKQDYLKELSEETNFLSIVDRIKNDITTLKTLSKTSSNIPDLNKNENICEDKKASVVPKQEKDETESNSNIATHDQDKSIDHKQTGIKVALDRVYREKSVGGEVEVPKELSSHLQSLSSANISEELRRSCSNIVAR